MMMVELQKKIMSTNIMTTTIMSVMILLLLQSSWLQAFIVIPTTTTTTSRTRTTIRTTTSSSALLSFSSSSTVSEVPSSAVSNSKESTNSKESKSTMILISPPGGVGEVTAVKCAEMGMFVKWFVISSPPLKPPDDDDTFIDLKKLEQIQRNQGNDETTSSATDQVVLTQEALYSISMGGGTIELAGTDTRSLLLPYDDPESSISALESWCTSTNSVDSTTNGSTMIDSIVCTYDGIDAIDVYGNKKKNMDNSSGGGQRQRLEKRLRTKREIEEEDIFQSTWKDAIKVAARSVIQSTTTTATKKKNARGEEETTTTTTKKIAIVSANDKNEGDLYRGLRDDEDEESGGGDNNSNNLRNLVGNFLSGGGGGEKPIEIPSTLTDAMSGTGGGISTSSSNGITLLRYGQLFGIPESSPDFTPFMGGPRKDYEFCEEYMRRTIRIDPTITITGNIMMDETTTRSSRHSVGEAAALMSIGKLPTTTTKSSSAATTTTGLDICISSQVGIEPVTYDEWITEFDRVQELISSKDGGSDSSSTSSSSSAMIQLFTAEFESVPNVRRLADWLATKWAPAVMRTYDIAAIRTGGRPVYALRVDKSTDTDTSDDDTTTTEIVEIVWQQLMKDFNAVTSGKMIIEVNNKGVVAYRSSGDPNYEGFGVVSRKPLKGENVLVRRLADATSQAIEKGLAMKPKPTKKIVDVEEKEPVVASATTSLQSANTVAQQEVATVPAAAAAAAAAAATAASTESSSSGPRKAGARRSKQRARGSKRRKAAGTATNKPSKQQQ